MLLARNDSDIYSTGTESVQQGEHLHCKIKSSCRPQSILRSIPERLQNISQASRRRASARRSNGVNNDGQHQEWGSSMHMGICWIKNPWHGLSGTYCSCDIYYCIFVVKEFWIQFSLEKKEKKKKRKRNHGTAWTMKFLSIYVRFILEYPYGCALKKWRLTTIYFCMYKPLQEKNLSSFLIYLRQNYT